ncbi:MAG TPA: metallophosphoesterase [Polyangiaceae bacterium]|nr:metallophosphoesterase [Polyangiaceae bacterium]
MDTPLAPRAQHRPAKRQGWLSSRVRVGALMLLVVTGLAAWALWFEPRRLVLRQVALELPAWPQPLVGLRVALMSDLHVGSPHWSLERLEALVAATNREQPELVLLAGDYLINGVLGGRWVDPESIARVLGGLRAPLGTVAVLGNHDWWNDGERVRRAFEQEGIGVLENEVLPLTRQGQRLFVAGLADQMTRRVALQQTLEQVPAGAPLLVLAHEPDIFPELDARASLTLAGHTHGGQVWLPILGRLVVPSEYGQRYAAGHVVEDGRHLFVTTGVGTSIWPLRFGVPPEVVLLTLR